MLEKLAKLKMADLLSIAFKTVWNIVFLAFSVVQYIAYYEGLAFATQEFANRMMLMLAMVLTFMFRLDIIAAFVGCYGMWQVWHWPLWVSVLISVIFESMSWAIYHGPGTKPVTFLQNWLPKKKATTTDKGEAQ